MGYPLPKCPFDGEDCERSGYCDASWFEDGKVVKQLYRCSRFKPNAKPNFGV